MSQIQFTPEMMQQFMDFMASNGQLPVTKAPEQVRPEVKSEGVEKSKRKYNRTKPDTQAKEHEVGHREIDSKGRVHEVVVVPAFGGVRKAWKIIPNLANNSRPVEVSKTKTKQVNFAPLVDYASSDDDEDVDPSKMTVTISDEERDVEIKTENTTEKSKRKYNSSKPKIDPREHGEGAVVESEGKMWIVAEVKTRGDGRRLLWKILKPDTETTEMPENLDEMDDSVAANLLLNLSSTTTEEIPVEKVEKVEKPKKARPGPEESASNYEVGTVLTGKDGQTMFKCVERTRKGKEGAEDKTYKVWQKMKAQ